MNSTKEKILDIAENLIRTQGYNAFSYADIADVLRIKKATIHYYFPSKSDLGEAVIEQVLGRYTDLFGQWTDFDCKTQYVNFINIYRESRERQWACLLGALSPSYETLSENMQTKLKVLGATIHDWLTDLLERGRQQGIFHFTDAPHTRAYLIQSALITSLLLNKMYGEAVYQIIQEGILDI